MTVPPCIFNLSELRTLGLNSCGIKELPDTFDKLKKLSRLDTGSNSIIAVPQSLSKLMLLTYFKIDTVQLYSVPHSQMNSNTTVTFRSFVAYGRQKCFPSFINKTDEEIEALIAEKCGIQNFSTLLLDQPSDIQKIDSFISNECRRFESAASLKNNNAGDGLPPELFMLKRLEVLDLSHQNIMRIPNEISRLNRLRQLVLNGCMYLQEISEQLASIESFECDL